MASNNSVLKRLLGVERVVIEHWDFEEGTGDFAVRVRLPRKGRRRCSRCGRRCPLYDRGGGLRRWRGLDLGVTKVFLEAESPRVECRQCGVVVAAVPWARPDSGFTRDFEDQCAWLAAHTSKTAVSQLARIAWRTVGRIVDSVTTEARRRVDLLSGLRRIGIDELSYRKGHKYLTVVIDHDTGRLVWMAPGRDTATVRAFFAELGPERTKELQLVSADGAAWIDEPVRECAPHVVRCLDPFHVVQWATKALDEVRRQVWNELRQEGSHDDAKDLKGARWALWRNPEDLSSKQRTTLAWIAVVNAPLYRAYLLKEALRAIFRAPSLDKAIERIDKWLAWASRSRLKPFVKLARTVRAYRPRLHAALAYGLSNSIVEGKNSQLRLLVRIAHGFHNVSSLINLSMLKLSGLCPPLPGRLQAPTNMS